MLIEIAEMTPEDITGVIQLWESTPGLVMHTADSPESIERYLERNVGLSFVARVNQQVVGAVLCGTDGRRGYLQHLVVEPAFRRQGIGRALVERCKTALSRENIEKCHLFVLPGNTVAQRFWNQVGWTVREDLIMMSATLNDENR